MTRLIVVALDDDDADQSAKEMFKLIQQKRHTVGIATTEYPIGETPGDDPRSEDMNIESAVQTAMMIRERSIERYERAHGGVCGRCNRRFTKRNPAPHIGC